MTLTNAILAAVAIVGWLGFYWSIRIIDVMCDRARDLQADVRHWQAEATYWKRRAERERDAQVDMLILHPTRHEHWEN